MSVTNDSETAFAYEERLKDKRIDLAESIPLSGPLSVHIEPTNICNFKCKCCPQSFSNYKEKAGGLFQLSMDDFEIIANQLSTLPPVKQLNLFLMGEPFVNKELINFIKMAKDKNLSKCYMVSSNGVLLTSEKYQSLCESGLDFLRISIFGSNEEIHSDITQSKIKLSKVKENIENFQKFKSLNGFSKPRTIVKMIDTENAESNEEFISDFTGLGDETLLEPLTNWNDPVEGNLSKKDKSDLMLTRHYQRKKKVCSYPFYSLIIHSDLQVSVCCVDWGKKTLIGDLRRETLIEIWNGEKLRNIQLKHIQGKKSELEGCGNCTYIHTAIDNIDALDEKTFLSRLK